MIRAGQSAADAAKVRKGKALLDAARRDALSRAGTPGVVSLTIKQETTSEILSEARREELKRKRAESGQP